MRITSKYRYLLQLQDVDSNPRATSSKRKRIAEAKPVPTSGPIRGRVCGWGGEVCVEHGEKVAESVLERTL